jgi:hypothetical protein
MLLKFCHSQRALVPRQVCTLQWYICNHPVINTFHIMKCSVPHFSFKRIFNGNITLATQSCIQYTLSLIPHLKLWPIGLQMTRNFEECHRGNAQEGGQFQVKKSWELLYFILHLTVTIINTTHFWFEDARFRMCSIVIIWIVRPTWQLLNALHVNIQEQFPHTKILNVCKKKNLLQPRIQSISRCW